MNIKEKEEIKSLFVEKFEELSGLDSSGIKHYCLKDAKLYKSRSEWQKNSSTMYLIAWQYGWLNEACQHMKEIRKPRGYWNRETCIAEAKKYKTKTEWNTHSFSSYTTAKWLGIFEEASAHMKQKKVPDEKWESGALSEEEITRLGLKRMPSGYWDDKDIVLAEAKKYATKTLWNKFSHQSYMSAKKLGIFEEASKHMHKDNK